MWLVFLFLFFIFGAANALMRRVLAQKFDEHNKLINAVFYVFFLLPAGVFLSLFFPHEADVSAVDLLLLVGGGVIWPLFNIFAFHASKTVDAGIYTIIANLSPLFTIVIAIPFLNEHLTTVQYLGVALLIVSGIIAVSPSIKKSDRILVSGLLFALLSAAFLGVGVAYERFMLNRVDLGTYLVLGWGSQVVWMALFAVREWHYLPQLVRKVGPRMLIAWGSANAIKSCCFILALFLSGSASIVSGSTNFIAIVIIGAAFFILHERDHIAQKIFAALVGIIGLSLVAM